MKDYQHVSSIWELGSCFLNIHSCLCRQPQFNLVVYKHRKVSKLDNRVARKMYFFKKKREKKTEYQKECRIKIIYIYVYIILYLNIHMSIFIFENIIYKLIFKYKIIYNINTYVFIIILAMVLDKLYFKAESKGNRSLKLWVTL